MLLFLKDPVGNRTALLEDEPAAARAVAIIVLKQRGLPDEIEKNVKLYTKTAIKCVRGLPGNSAAIMLKDSVSKLKSTLPAIVAIGNKYIRDRHWENINKIVGFQIHGSNIYFI